MKMMRPFLGGSGEMEEGAASRIIRPAPRLSPYGFLGSLFRTNPLSWGSAPLPGCGPPGCRPPGCRPPGCRPPGCRPPGCRPAGALRALRQAHGSLSRGSAPLPTAALREPTPDGAGSLRLACFCCLRGGVFEMPSHPRGCWIGSSSTSRAPRAPGARLPSTESDPFHSSGSVGSP